MRKLFVILLLVTVMAIAMIGIWQTWNLNVLFACLVALFVSGTGILMTAEADEENE